MSDEVPKKSKIPACCETDSDELVLKRKPLNNIVRRLRASHQLRCIIEELAAKVRLVVCGNWKKGATPHAPENQSLNGAEAIRIAASLLAQVELTCWCETWEATALEALVQALQPANIGDGSDGAVIGAVMFQLSQKYPQPRQDWRTFDDGSIKAILRAALFYRGCRTLRHGAMDNCEVCPSSYLKFQESSSDDRVRFLFRVVFQHSLLWTSVTPMLVN